MRPALVLCLIALAVGEDGGVPGVDDAAEGMGSGCGCNALTRDAANDALDGEDGAAKYKDGSAPTPQPTTVSPSSLSQSNGEDGVQTFGSDGKQEEEEADDLSQLIAIEGGRFIMGSNAGFFPQDGEGPAFKVKISPFRIGAHEVSNARFAAFVDATGYVTEAESFGNSFVVEQFVSHAISSKIQSAVAAAPWWIPVTNSNWRFPEGPDSNLTSGRGDRMSHPVVHVSWNDALAFCRWSAKGGRLPTEAEWEFAASGGKKGKHFPWGNKLGKTHKMNTWQSGIEDRFLKNKNVFKHSFLPTEDGHNFFSSLNTASDGWELTAPVDSFKPNGFGLYNTVGNVWEWTNDWNAPGADRTSYGLQDPKGPVAGDNKVKKGGSFMCHQFTCYRYRIAARMFITPDSSASNVGFRCAADAIE